MEKVTRTHMFNVVGYSLDKNIGGGKFYESTNFEVGGHDWSIRYFPNDDISIFLYLKSRSECVRAQVSFTIVDQNGNASPLSKTTEIICFKTDSRSCGNGGYTSFAKREVFESNIKNDCFVIKSVVTVIKVIPVEPIAPIVVPSGNILQEFGNLLESGKGADVTFEVDCQIISAHKCILAARSPVFSAQFFGPLKITSDSTIIIKEMEASVIKALLHFIYNDSLPGFADKNISDEKHETKLMAQQLLIAADRYGLERLKIICEKMLCDSIDMSDVFTLLSLSESRSCNHLKETCLKFLTSPGNFQEVAATEKFQELVKNDPLILKELLDKRNYNM